MSAEPRLRTLYDWISGSGGSVSGRLLRSGIWIGLGEGIARTSSIARLAVLGRLLTPGDFGAVAVATVLLRWTDYFSQTGIQQALIQKRADIRPYFDTTFTIQAVRGAVLCALLFLAAPLARIWFRSPDSALCVRAVAFVLLLRGFVNPAVVLLRKDLDFRRDVWWRYSGTLSGLAVAIAVALIWRNLWALILSLLASQVTEVLVSYAVTRYKPRLAFQRQRAADLLRFGKWIFWSNAFSFLNLYADQLLVGRLFGTTSLGLYQVASQLAVVPTVLIGGHLSSLTLPAFSSLNNPARSRQAFLRLLRLVLLSLIPVGILITTFGPVIVDLLLGARWHNCGELLQVLIWAGIATALCDITNAVMMAAGRPDLSFQFTALRFILMAAIMWPLLHAGMRGIAVALTISASLTMLAQLSTALALLGIRLRDTRQILTTVLTAVAPFVAARVVFSSSGHPVVLGAMSGAVLIHLLLFGRTLKAEFRSRV